MPQDVCAPGILLFCVGVVIGSNVFNLAALLGLAAVVAGWACGCRPGGSGGWWRRSTGTVIIAGYLAFATALVITVE